MLEHVAQRARRRPTRGAGRDAVLAGEANEVPHDEEVAGETHAIDDAQFVDRADP